MNYLFGLGMAMLAFAMDLLFRERLWSCSSPWRFARPLGSKQGRSGDRGVRFWFGSRTEYQTKCSDDVGPLSHIMFEEQRDRDYNARVLGHPASDEH